MTPKMDRKCSQKRMKKQETDTKSRKGEVNKKQTRLGYFTGPEWPPEWIENAAKNSSKNKTTDTKSQEGDWKVGNVLGKEV